MPEYLDITTIKVGGSRKIGPDIVFRRNEDLYMVNGTEYNYQTLLEYLGIKPEAKKTPDTTPSTDIEVTSKGDQDIIGVALVEAPARVISYHIPHNKRDYLILKIASRARGLIMYFTSTHIKNGKYYSNQPWYYDFTALDSASKIKEIIGEERLRCPFCGRESANLSTFVQHIKSDHSIYKPSRPVKESEPELEQNQPSENHNEIKQKEQDGYKCQYCEKVLKSKFGRTNHMNSGHPELLESNSSF
jgi:uncharacterized C2H2 Zn-finger protein